MRNRSYGASGFGSGHDQAYQKGERPPIAKTQIPRGIVSNGIGDDAVRRRGVHVTVVSTMKCHLPMIADELRRQADVFTDLAELKAAISRT
jgi:hypothetical protein